jgi:hypothetical protein
MKKIKKKSLMSKIKKSIDLQSLVRKKNIAEVQEEVRFFLMINKKSVYSTKKKKKLMRKIKLKLQ